MTLQIHLYHYLLRTNFITFSLQLKALVPLDEILDFSHILLWSTSGMTAELPMAGCEILRT